MEKRSFAREALSLEAKPWMWGVCTAFCSGCPLQLGHLTRARLLGLSQHRNASKSQLSRLCRHRRRSCRLPRHGGAAGCSILCVQGSVRAQAHSGSGFMTVSTSRQEGRESRVPRRGQDNREIMEECSSSERSIPTTASQSNKLRVSSTASSSLSLLEIFIWIQLSRCCGICTKVGHHRRSDVLHALPIHPSTA